MVEVTPSMACQVRRRTWKEGKVVALRQEPFHPYLLGHAASAGHVGTHQVEPAQRDVEEAGQHCVAHPRECTERESRDLHLV